MKKIISIIILSAFTGIITSCTNWLEHTPYDQVPGDELYATESGAQEALNGLYLGLLSRNLYGGELTVGMIEALSMHYYVPEDHKYDELVSFEYSTSDSKSYFLNIWKGMYKLIAECNVFLANIEENRSNYDEDNYNLYWGEAIALRTFLHFDLFSMFAPVWSEENKSQRAISYYDREVEQPTAYLTVEELAQQLLTDIDEAIALLANDPILENTDYVSQGETFWDFRNFRFNIYAAYALKARMCLTTGDKTTAYNIATALLESRFPEGGSNNFANIFPSVLDAPEDDPIGYTEMLFGMHDINRKDMYDTYFSTELQPTSVCAVSEARHSELFPLAQDIRRNNFASASSISEATPLMSITKYQEQEAHTADDLLYRYDIIPLIKKGELYLIAAEATDNETEKQHWLEELRLTRGYFENNVSGDLNQLVEEEYEREFYAEGQYFFYLKRNGITTLPDPSASDASSTQTVSASYYVFPIPEEETNNRTDN